MARSADRTDHISDCEFCRDDSHARLFLTDLRKIILRVFAISEFSHSLLPGSIGHIRTGKVRALGVTASKRVAALPDVPAIAETVPGYEASVWYGIAAPKGTPPDIIATLNQAVNAVLADPKLQARLAELGGEAMPLTAAEFGKLVVAETEKWAKVVKFAGAKAD
jgi:tripartite-type tricarboxylate transporter receptor subunit TctC